jgi:predicted Zn finger-like uncharacterized protein
MILTCPQCGTQYVVKDGAIPPEGRQVRCASCKHSWHQDPDREAHAESPAVADETPAGAQTAEAEIREPDSEPEAAEAPESDESLAEATLIEPRSGPEAEERAFEEASVESETHTIGEEPIDEQLSSEADSGQVETEVLAPPPPQDFSEPPHAEAKEDEFTPYPSPDEEGPAKRSPLLVILLIIALVIVAAAAFWFLAPTDLKARLGLTGMGTTPLALVTTHMDRQRLESGNELLTVTGRVINPTRKSQPVPPLRAQLKTKQGKVVYSWTIAPPAASLAPGESKSFNSAEVSVPPGGEELTITLGGVST